MALLEDLLDLAGKLDPAAKPVLDDVPDLVGAVIHTLDAAGIKVPAAVADQASAPPAPAETPAQDEPETVGSTVADVQPPEPPAAADPLNTYSVDQLTEELAKRQQAAVQQADAQKTQ